MFDVSGDVAPYIDLHRLFQSGEVINISNVAIEKGTLDTREFLERVMIAKGLDAGDRQLARSLCLRIFQDLRMQEKRGKVPAPVSARVSGSGAFKAFPRLRGL